LLRYVYERYPEFITNSIIVEKVLGKKEGEWQQCSTLTTYTNVITQEWVFNEKAIEQDLKYSQLGNSRYDENR